MELFVPSDKTIGQSRYGICIERGFFADVVRQTMAVDLSELMEPAPPRKQRSKREVKQEGSIVAAVEKEAVLAMVDQMEAALKKEEVWAIAHNENVSAWIEAIVRWLQTTAAGQVQFAQLCQDLGMPQIEVWLGVLLGGFELESQGEFYSGLLWVRGLSSSGTDTTGAIASQDLLGLSTLTATAHQPSATLGRERFPNASL